jgi:hemoglobin
MQIEEKPPGTAPFDTPFAWIGGEANVKALVERFYDLMDLEPGYAAVRAVHGSTLEVARQRLFWFLCGWMGGPQHYTDRFGHPRLRMRHMGLLGSDTNFAAVQGTALAGRAEGSANLDSDPKNPGATGSIGIRERDQWLACMDQAMRETGVDEALRTRLNTSFFQTADWMRNRGE